jgi:hypothetical protein
MRSVTPPRKFFQAQTNHVVNQPRRKKPYRLMCPLVRRESSPKGTILEPPTRPYTLNPLRATAEYVAFFWGGLLKIVSDISEERTLDAPRLDASFAHRRQDLEAALVSQGLYPKEAHAMVDTWRDSWFEEGSRLIYLVPRATVDTILPLQIDPAPSEIARVFVGHIELLTLETKRTVEAAVKTGNWQVVGRYQRFLTPILDPIFTADHAAGNGFSKRLSASTSTPWRKPSGDCEACKPLKCLAKREQFEPSVEL